MPISVEYLIGMNSVIFGVILGLSCCIVIISFRDVGMFFLYAGGVTPGESINIPIF